MTFSLITGRRTLSAELLATALIGLWLCNAEPARSATIILTSDQQLNDLQDPDKRIDLSTGLEKQYGSLREICETAAQQGDRQLVIAFDEFFRQYRLQAGTERRLTPDQDEYIQKIARIGSFAARYHMGIGLSLLSPLELGPAFINHTGQAGRWLHYTVTDRDQETGRFSTQLWRQRYWTNNKGTFTVKLKSVRAFAFKEKTLADGRYSAVDPKDIHEISSGIQLVEWSLPPSSGRGSNDGLGPFSQRVQIQHSGDGLLKGYDRVFILLEYETPEMDYFSDQALPFLTDLIKKYSDHKINLVSLYSDEMHIQQDWRYFSHHDYGQFCLRYLTHSMSAEYARRYGDAYRDMDKYLLYFYSGPKLFSDRPTACSATQYVMGSNPEAMARTWLFRDRYYKLLNNHVVDLFKQAKDYAEKVFGCELATHAHASWAQSPTIDLWNTGPLHLCAYQYEYTPNFVWSNTVHQAAAACYDYWKWGEYLQPTGNDFAEGGWSDRNYYGAALAASIGMVNRYPNAYAAFWGMPAEVQERKQAVNSAFGGSATATIEAITENQHRDVDVLILYPMNLVAVEERFGSWMVQYAYANYITAEKLLEQATLSDDGRILIAGRSFSTLVALCEVLPPDGLLPMMETMARRGGHVLWCGSPPRMTQSGVSCLEEWQNLFGVDYTLSLHFGEIAAGKQVRFVRTWQHIAGQTILTDFMVDYIYPVHKRESAQEVAWVDDRLVGVIRKLDRGEVAFCGFRPRDDQSASLGYESSTLFNILQALGAYPASGRFPGVNDNTEVLSRTTPFLATRFPNHTTVIAAHHRLYRESWPGGFSRNRAIDEQVMRDNPLPSDALRLEKTAVNGHEITYCGRLICAFRLDDSGRLIAFEGHGCKEIEIDRVRYRFSDSPLPLIAWAPVFSPPPLPETPLLQIRGQGSGRMAIPWPFSAAPKKIYRIQPGAQKGTVPVEFTYDGHSLLLVLTPQLQDRWLYVCQ